MKKTGYLPEVRELAVRMVFDRQGEHHSQRAAIDSLADKTVVARPILLTMRLKTNPISLRCIAILSGWPRTGGFIPDSGPYSTDARAPAESLSPDSEQEPEDKRLVSLTCAV
jgi:hypothetical protein